jgi:hypothetical protein
MFQFTSYSIKDSLGVVFGTIATTNLFERPSDSVKRLFPNLSGELTINHFYVGSEPVNGESIMMGEFSPIN